MNARRRAAYAANIEQERFYLRNRKKASYARNPQKHRDLACLDRAKPGAKQRQVAISKAWAERNRDRTKAASRRWYQRNLAHARLQLGDLGNPHPSAARQATRELALFNLALDSKLRGCDLASLRVGDVAQGSRVSARAMVLQRKTQRPVQFELTEQTREAIAGWIAKANQRGETTAEGWAVVVLPRRAG